mgnify:CR=1 FL=1
MHAHGGAGASWVHVARLSNGQPVPGARVEWGALSAITDAFGIALVPDAPASGAVRVCDNDNVDVDGAPSAIGGTPAFQPPELVLNPGAAAALNLELTPALRAAANEVIQ